MRDRDRTEETSRDRRETRTVTTYPPGREIDRERWTDVRTVVRVDRQVTFLRDAHPPRQETAYFISSLPSDTPARVFQEGIRGHWQIENGLHYVKDKTLGEDDCRILKGNAPQILSLLRNVVLNALRRQGYDNIAQAIRLVSHNIPLLRKILLE